HRDVGFGGDQGLFGGVHRLEQLSHSCRTGVRSHSGNIRRPTDRNKRVVSSFADALTTAPYPRLAPLAGGTFPQPAVGGLFRDPLAPLGYSPSRAGGEIRDSPAAPSPNLRLGDYSGTPSLRSGTPPAEPGEKSGTRRRYLPPTCGWGTIPEPH